MTRVAPWTMQDILDRSIPEPNAGCWLWLLDLSYGYGRTTFRGKTERAHRTSWSLVNGPIPHGMEMHHKCKQTSCVNPDHLIPLMYADHRKADFPDGTINQNTHKTHCMRGHELSGRNLIIEKSKTKRGFSRVCRICLYDKRRRARLRKKGEV